MTKYKIKQIIFILLIIILIISVFFSIKYNKKQETEQKVVTNNNELSENRNLCFYLGEPTSLEFYDISWLKLNIKGEYITGEYQNIPAGKDSKVGKFEGTLGKFDQSNMNRDSIVWWQATQEGISTKEQLYIKWGDGSATTGYGEMVDQGNNVYSYKDTNNLSYTKAMNQIDCESLDEKLSVEKYVQKNISIIATNKSVLGGNWFTYYVNVDFNTKTGEVEYEDGHIKSKANFTYTYNKINNEIKITKFEVVK